MKKMFSGGWFLKWFTVGVYVFIFAPIGVVILMSFHPMDIVSFPMPGFSLKWYLRFFSNYRLLDSLRISVLLGIVSALVSGIIGTMAAFGLVRGQFKGKELLNALIFAPMVLSGVVMGVALLAFYQFTHLPRGFWGLVIAHTLFTLPYVVIVVAARLAGFNRFLEEAAMNLGANRLQTLRKVTLPIIAPGIIGGMMLAFTISFDEFPATQFLATPYTNTIPIRVFSMIKTELSPQINVLATVMIVITVGLPVIAHYVLRKK